MPTDPTRAQAVFVAAAEITDPDARAAFLVKTCGDDLHLKSRVEALLRAHDQPDSLLDVPLVAPPDTDHASTRAFAPDPDHAATRTGGGTPGDAENDEVPLGFLAPATRPDSLGRIGHYEILQILGQGAFGIVFRAFDDVLHRVVAVKVLSPQMAATSPARKRFLREARSSAQVRHENVVQAYEVGEQPLPYIVMEFIPGETLQQRLDRTGPVDVAEVVRVGRQIAEGLAAAHANDLIHRDIKPGNILLEGGAGRVKITDFGLARAADDASISQSGIIAGTPMYMAPEQAKGETLDQRADLFSLGSVLYQMAAGRAPFRANGTVAVLKRVAEDTPRDIREITPETPQWLCDIIAKLHAKNPDDRYQSAREVADVLADCEAQLKANSKLKDFSRIPRGRAKPSGRQKWVAAAVVLLFPVIALAVTEFTGVTHLLRGHAAKAEPIRSEDEPSSLAKNELPSEGGDWIQLFNGQDLAGWKPHPDQLGEWSVFDQILVGTGPGQLYTIRDDYRNFHLRAEMKISNGANDGISFRANLQPPSPPGKARTPSGYMVEVAEGQDNYTGPISFHNPQNGSWTTYGAKSIVKPGEWFTLDLIADGNRLVTKVNSVTAVDFVEELNAYKKGHIALQVRNGGNVKFRKIEIKELAPVSAALPPTFKNSIGMEFVIVPKGKSWLGGGKDKMGDKEVVIPADFYLGKYEVTQEEWNQVMGENPSHFSRNGEGKDAVKDISDADLKRFPVENVSWDQSQIFVEKLNKLEKETGWVYRLPKEAEWEYACRGGPMSNKLDSAFDFYFAKQTNTLLPDLANFEHGNGLKRKCKVGSYQPNVLGLYDMHGNAWEWCEDTEKAADGVSLRVYRGGCWFNDSGYCRAANRDTRPPSFRGNNLGLRLARVPSVALSPEVKTPPLAVAPFSDADVQRIAALPAEQQVEEVRKELMRRNPSFDGKMEYKIKDGVVTEFKIVTDKVADIAPIRVFKTLRVLDCCGTYSNKSNGLLADLTPLEGMNLAGLTHLKLNNTKVGDAGLANFKDCKNLLELHLWNTKSTDAGLANFKDCKDLIILDLGGTRLTDAGLANFKDCKSLTGLYLYWTKVTDAGLVDFQDCQDLTCLSLAGTKVSEMALARFKNCKNLTSLHFDNMRIGEAGLAHFKGMPLMSVWIDNTDITDLTPLQDMPLEDIRLTPKNITRGLDILRDMKSLKTIGTEWDKSWPAAEFWERYDKGEFKVP